MGTTLRSRHLTGLLRENPRPRLSRLGNLEDLTGAETPRQRTAHELIAAEGDLTEYQTRLVYARRDGDPAQASLAAASRDATTRRIDRLRIELHAERRRELLRG